MDLNNTILRSNKSSGYHRKDRIRRHLSGTNPRCRGNRAQPNIWRDFRNKFDKDQVCREASMINNGAIRAASRITSPITLNFRISVRVLVAGRPIGIFALLDTHQKQVSLGK